MAQTRGGALERAAAVPAEMRERIEELKSERDAVILAHYYVEPEVQTVADYVGDSFYLAKLAKTLPQQTIVLCGVEFMGESAKLLNRDKTVLLPEPAADCPMAHMVRRATIDGARAEYGDDLAVVCYVNSTMEIKSWSDVCVTSSNAVKIVRELPQHHILFIPDRNLGRHVAQQVPEKHVIIGFAEASPASEFHNVTVDGVLYELERRCAGQGKRFYVTNTPPTCADMDGITLDKLVACLESGSGAVDISVDEDAARAAQRTLDRMLEYAAR